VNFISSFINEKTQKYTLFESQHYYNYYFQWSLLLNFSISWIKKFVDSDKFSTSSGFKVGLWWIQIIRICCEVKKSCVWLKNLVILFVETVVLKKQNRLKNLTACL